MQLSSSALDWASCERWRRDAHHTDVLKRALMHAFFPPAAPGGGVAKARPQFFVNAVLVWHERAICHGRRINNLSVRFFI